MIVVVLTGVASLPVSGAGPGSDKQFEKRNESNRTESNRIDVRTDYLLIFGI